MEWNDIESLTGAVTGYLAAFGGIATGRPVTDPGAMATAADKLHEAIDHYEAWDWDWDNATLLTHGALADDGLPHAIYVCGLLDLLSRKHLDMLLDYDDRAGELEAFANDALDAFKEMEDDLKEWESYQPTDGDRHAEKTLRRWREGKLGNMTLPDAIQRYVIKSLTDEAARARLRKVMLLVTDDQELCEALSVAAMGTYEDEYDLHAALSMFTQNESHTGGTDPDIFPVELEMARGAFDALTATGMMEHDGDRYRWTATGSLYALFVCAVSHHYEKELERADKQRSGVAWRFFKKAITNSDEMKKPENSVSRWKVYGLPGGGGDLLDTLKAAGIDTASFMKKHNL